MKNLRFILAGCGRIGQRHANLISERGSLAAVCDILPQRATLLAGKYACRSYTDIREMINSENADLLVVCTPNGLHAQHSIIGLDAGMNVLCEKPMAINVNDCEEMIRNATASKKDLFVVKQNRFNPPVAAIKELLREGKLGDISSFQLNCFWHRPASYYENSWHGSKEMDGGTLFTQFSHFIDILYWYLGDVDQVEAIGGNFQHNGLMDFEDCGVVLLKMKSGAIGTLNYNVNANEQNMEGSITLFGSRGTVKVGGEYLNRLDYFKVDGLNVPRLEPGNAANQYGDHSGSMNNHAEVYTQVQLHLNGEPSKLPGLQDAMKTVEIISKIYKQMRS